MKAAFRFFILLTLTLCICYYLGFDFTKPINAIIGKTQNSIDNNVDLTVGQATMPDQSKADAGTKTEPEAEAEQKVLSGLVAFIKAQKEGNKLVGSYRTEEESLKDKSYLYDDALAVIALTNVKDGDAEALDILKNMAALQNEDGSWYDIYDIFGQTVKVSGKTNTSKNTGNNALMLYAYSYYTNATNDNQFADVMKKCADYLLTMSDGKSQGLYNSEVSEKGIRSLKANAYSYFGLREYAMSCIRSNYEEYKSKLFAAQAIASWTTLNLYNKGIFVKEYTGITKSTVVDLDSQVIGCMLVKSSSPSIKYEESDMEGVLVKLHQQSEYMDGYRMDDSSKNSGYIWCRGTCSVPLAFIKLGNHGKAMEEAAKIDKAYEKSSDNTIIKGVQLSTNIDSKIDLPDSEAVSSSAWGAISLQCLSDETTNKSCFGKEEDVFKMTAK